MGLDIYLYPRAAAEANRKHYEIWNEDEDGNYAASSMSDDERKAHDEQFPRMPHQDVPSERYPGHLCNRRYLRSSYNSGGFNNVTSQMIGEERGYYWIFEPIGRDWRNGEDDEPLTAADIPGLRESRKRALALAEELQTIDPYAAITVGHNVFSGLAKVSDDEAVATYRKEIERQSQGWYSNGRGEFFRSDPPTILAAIPGVDVLGAPAVHLIYRRADMDHYVQSAEITAEFCDEAIALIERDGSCEMSWSW